MSALELVPLPEIPNSVMPGTKVVLRGPLTARKGVIMLSKPGQITLLGGGVEEMKEEHQLQTVLRRRIGGREDVGQIRRFQESQQPQQQGELRQQQQHVQQQQDQPLPPQHEEQQQQHQDEFEGEDSDWGVEFGEDEDELLLAAASQMENQVDSRETHAAQFNIDFGEIEDWDEMDVGVNVYHKHVL